jgi:tripartite-type tricarboxylate transporter receptor subunit TctC
MKRVSAGWLSIFLSLILALAATQGLTQNYPSRTVRVVVPFAPGGATDAVLRMLAPRLSENLGQPVVVDNRPGGASTIGMDMVAKSAPDGYTLGVANLSFSINPTLFGAKLPYNTEKDFALVSLVTIVPLVMSVHPSVPARSIKELIALAKAKPGSLNYSSSGNASATQMATELFRYMSGINIVHVPYNGGGPALISVLSGQVSIYAGSIPTLLPHFRSGKLIGLAITTAKRDPAIPELPTIAEAALPGFDSREWQGIVVPAATPTGIINRLHQDIVKTLNSPELKERFASVGATAVGSTAEEFAVHLKQEMATMGRVIREAGIRIE